MMRCVVEWVEFNRTWKCSKFSFFLLKYCQGVGISNEERVYIFLSGGRVEEFPAQKKHQTYTIKNSLHLNDPRWLSRLSFFVSRTTAWVVNLLNFFLPHFNRNLSSSFVVEIFLLFSPFFVSTRMINKFSATHLKNDINFEAFYLRNYLITSKKH